MKIGRDGLGSRRLACLLRRALENEASIDETSARSLLDASCLKGLPCFKQVKLQPLRNRLGRAFRPLFAVACALSLVRIPVDWLRVIVLGVPRRSMANSTMLGFDFFDRNHELVERAIASTATTEVLPAVHWLSRSEVLRSLTRDRLFTALIGHARLISQCLRERTFHLLYLRDALDLAIVGLYAQQNVAAVFVTANVFQHRAFILGATAKRCWIVQHGIVNRNYDPPHAFSAVERIYALTNEEFEAQTRYYTSLEMRLVPALDFTSNPLGRDCVLVGSSAPSVDMEIRFCQWLRAESDVAIAIKLHPAHLYDARGKDLVGYADYVVCANENLDCEVFVSFASSYAVHYRAHGSAVISLNDYAEMREAARYAVELVKG